MVDVFSSIVVPKMLDLRITVILGEIDVFYEDGRGLQHLTDEIDPGVPGEVVDAVDVI